MIVKDVQQLNAEFDKLGNSDNLALIQFYEANLESINHIDTSQDNNHYDSKMRLQSEYGLSLVSAGYYTKALMVLADSIQMFENSPSIENDKIYTITYFEHLLWNYGVALWETKRIHDATLLFERLVRNYPKNEKYRAWLNGLKAEKIKKITKPFWIICGIWLLGELTLFEKFDPSIQLTLALVGVLFLVVVGIAELYIYLTMKKKASV